MKNFLAALTRARKALAPLILGVVAVPVQWVADGNFDLVAFRTALAGLVTAAVVWYVKNEPAAPPPPATGQSLGSAVVVTPPK